MSGFGTLVLDDFDLLRRYHPIQLLSCFTLPVQDSGFVAGHLTRPGGSRRAYADRQTSLVIEPRTGQPRDASRSRRPASHSDTFLRKQESSVRRLQSLYTIVSGLALSDAVATLVREDIQGQEWIATISLLIAFVITLIPFFHGAMRHLDDVFLIDPDRRLKTTSLAVDFGFLFLEGLLLFLLAHWIVEPERFFWALPALLVIDVVWAIVTHIHSNQREGDRSRRGRTLVVEILTAIQVAKWAMINIVCIGVLIALVVLRLVVDRYSSASPSLIVQGSAVLIGATAVARTVVDYAHSWNFYFPSQEE